MHIRLFVWFIDIIRRGILTPYVELKLKWQNLGTSVYGWTMYSNTIEFINRPWVYKPMASCRTCLHAPRPHSFLLALLRYSIRENSSSKSMLMVLEANTEVSSSDGSTSSSPSGSSSTSSSTLGSWTSDGHDMRVSCNFLYNETAGNLRRRRIVQNLKKSVEDAKSWDDAA